MTRPFERSGSWIGLSVMAAAAFLYGWSAIVMPSWLFSLLMPLLWVALFALSCLWFTRHPYRVLGVSALTIATWFVAVLA